MFPLCVPVSKCTGKQENSGGRQHMPGLQTRTKLPHLIWSLRGLMASCQQEHGEGTGWWKWPCRAAGCPSWVTSLQPQPTAERAILLPGRNTHLHFNYLRVQMLKLRETKANSAHLLHSSAATLIIASPLFSTAVHLFFKLLYVYSF